MKVKGWLGGVLLSVSIPAYADFEAGLAEYQRGNFASAAHEWREAAELGDGESQFALGRLFERGSGVREDINEAYKWYRLAAGNAVLDAQLRVAELFLSGRIDGRGPEDALEWLERAAELGHAGAQFQLGLMKLEGYGTAEDPVAAARWFKQAAEQGHVQAQNNIGSLYENGRGVEQDYARAFDYFNLAARQGDAMAQNNLGALYARGRGVERNHAWAVFWFSMAARNGNEVAQGNIQPSLAHLQSGSIGGSRVNVRSGGGTEHAPVAQLGQGDVVYVLGQMEGWSQVYFELAGEPQLGWVSSTLIHEN